LGLKGGYPFTERLPTEQLRGLVSQSETFGSAKLKGDIPFTEQLRGLVSQSETFGSAKLKGGYPFTERLPTEQLRGLKGDIPFTLLK